MFSLMKRVVKHTLTDYDNETYDTGRVLAAFSTLFVLLLTTYIVWKAKEIDLPGGATLLTGLGTALAAILAGCALYLVGDNAKRPPISMSIEPNTTPTPPPVPIGRTTLQPKYTSTVDLVQDARSIGFRQGVYLDGAMIYEGPEPHLQYKAETDGSITVIT
jgi:hypothetical protein